MLDSLVAQARQVMDTGKCNVSTLPLPPSLYSMFTLIVHWLCCVTLNRSGNIPDVVHVMIYSWHVSKHYDPELD